MKTAVSLPDDLFERAEELARQRDETRSALFATALREYIDRHSADLVTVRMNKTVALIDADRDEFLARAARNVLENAEWK